LRVFRSVFLSHSAQSPVSFGPVVAADEPILWELRL